MGSSDALMVEEYGKPQEGLQFVSPWWVGFRVQPYLHGVESRVQSNAWRGVDLVSIRLVELASAGFRWSILSQYAD